MTTRDMVVDEVVRIVGSLAADWDYSGEINASTRLFVDINWQSVDMVVLAHELQTVYEQSFPFAEFFSRLQLRESPGLSVGELADFVFSNLGEKASSAPVAD